MVGATIGHYIVGEKLGEGGMGVVHKAEDSRLRRTVALKFLSSRALQDPELKELFIQEAQAAAALDHPNICTVHAIEEVEGRAFIAMAYVEGRSLAEKLKADGRWKSPKPSTSQSRSRAVCGRRTKTGSSTATSNPRICSSPTTGRSRSSISGSRS